MRHHKNSIVDLKSKAVALAVGGLFALATGAASAVTTTYGNASALGSTLVFSGGAMIGGTYTAPGSLLLGDLLIDQVEAGGLNVTTLNFDTALTSFGGFFDLNWSGSPAFPSYGPTGSGSEAIVVELWNGGSLVNSQCLFGNFNTCGISGSALNSAGDYKGFVNFAADLPSESFNKVVVHYQGNYTAEAYGLNNVRVTAVPEPETYAMMLAGLGALGFMARRRRAS